MDPGFQINNENPKITANCFSRFSFAWTLDIFRKSKKKELEISDLCNIMEEDKSEKLGDVLEHHWNKEVDDAKRTGRKPNLVKVLLLKLVGVDFMMWGTVMFTQMMFRAFQPLILSYFLKQFAEDKQPQDELDLYGFACLLVLSSFVIAACQHHMNYHFALMGMRCRTAVSSLVYRKITRLNQMSLGKTATGQVVNLLSNDVSRYDFVFIFLHAFWIAPIVIIVILYYLWMDIGISCLAGLIPNILLTLPLQGYLGKLSGILRNKIAVKTDYRVKLMSQIVSGIHVIKMYTWEKPFEIVIREVRKSELSDIMKTSYFRGVFTSWMMFLSGFSLFLTLTCFVLLGNHITSAIVFSTVQSFNILQTIFALHLPFAINNSSEAIAVSKRLRDFLILDEKELPSDKTLNEASIDIRDVTAYWTIEFTPTLVDINLRIIPGTLCAIVGPVGSGKSSLLQLLLGELIISTGQTQIGRDISYASQEPWLFRATVRNNIIFGQPFNKTWYEKVIYLCALDKDFEQLPQGDRSIVGDRGVLLSGGQKVRINLARAIYRESAVYLLDDPLSAVDTHVGRHIFNECISKHLKGRTRILVTHQLQYLRSADLIVLMDKGRISTTGTFEELVNSRIDFTEILASSHDANEEMEDIEMDNEIGMEPRRTLPLLKSFRDNIKTPETSNNLANEDQQESSSNPNVSSFKEYIKSINNICLIILVIFLLVLTQASRTIADFWVAFWVSQEELRYPRNTSENIESTSVFNNLSMPEDQPIITTETSLIIYATLTIASIVLTLARSFLFFIAAMRASKTLHAKMFHCLLLAPLKFFNNNSCGRILNRFSKDTGVIDELFPLTLLDTIQISLAMAGMMVNISLSNPYTVVSILCCGILFWKIVRLYILTSRNLKRLEAVAKSPVFSHVGSTLNGITTIRASKMENPLIAEFDHHQDIHSSAWTLAMTCSITFGLWLDMVCLIFVAFITFSFAILQDFSLVYSSLVGLALTQILGAMGSIQYGMKQISEIISLVTNVERVLQYTTVETEGPFETPKGNRPDKTWPKEGSIEFKNVSLQYDENHPLVLKDIDFAVQKGEKIGIVGRTGAGKSSLISAIFRLCDIQGSILIDAIDTKTLGLTDLRRKISIIPQEPLLFSATLRYNLDPFEEFDDTTLWKALEEVELKDSVPSLDHMIDEGGSNFSVGQRQLVCLARAILRNNQILILDEATANIDLRTESFIQNTIREKFKNCTVLTIAHRLNTVMDSDKVLVMDSGRNVEYDHAHKLLLNENGYLNKLVKETGPAISQILRDIAWKDYHSKEIELYEEYYI